MTKIVDAIQILYQGEKTSSSKKNFFNSKTTNAIKRIFLIENHLGNGWWAFREMANWKE